MAEPRKPFFMFRPKFLLLCLYVIAYILLRSSEDIVVHSIALPSPRGPEIFRMVGPHPDLPHWRQQLWRACFSPAMVVEEEGRKLMDRGRDLYSDARGTVQDAGQAVRQYTGQGQ